jgi:hypothetical protein
MTVELCNPAGARAELQRGGFNARIDPPARPMMKRAWPCYRFRNDFNSYWQ